MTQTTTKDNIRRINILRSPKQNGSSSIDSTPYLKELGISLMPNNQPIQFTSNYSSVVHRWAPYVQGFSATFVQSVIEKYRTEYQNPHIMDPFAGSGTVLVQAKLNGIKSYGVELNPLLAFVANTKLNYWMTSPEVFWEAYKSLDFSGIASAPPYLQSEKHFNPGVLANIKRIKYGIEEYCGRKNKDDAIYNLLKMAFSAILIDSSNLTRSPCLGYNKKKKVTNAAPLKLYEQKIKQIYDDLYTIQSSLKQNIATESIICLDNSNSHDFPSKYDLVITSPPYMNGMDYVINYKIEMGWLDFIENHNTSKKIKNEMVVCDNVSKSMISDFARSKKYSNKWIDDIKTSIDFHIKRRGSYRRMDMAEIVNKYFHDMYLIMKNVAQSIPKGGRFIQVIGDSLIVDTYVPTDLIIGKIGEELGMRLESVEVARTRRSGQVRSYKLRETIVTHIKE